MCNGLHQLHCGYADEGKSVQCSIAAAQIKTQLVCSKGGRHLLRLKNVANAAPFMPPVFNSCSQSKQHNADCEFAQLQATIGSATGRHSWR
jgi:hypothetical protein